MATKAPPLPHGYRCSMPHSHVYNRDGWSPCVQYGWMVPMCTIGMDGPHVYNKDGWSSCVQ